MRDWVRSNKQQLEVEILQLFCDVVKELREQFYRFSKTRTLSYPVLTKLVGIPSQKGLLWRLKDQSHLVLRDTENSLPEGILLDWAIGYIFHESIKLKEDARLHQSYLPRLTEFLSGSDECLLSMIVSDFHEIERQTEESLKREIARIELLFLLTIRLFCRHFSRCCSHRPLARFLFDYEKNIKDTFGEYYDVFIYAIYGEEIEKLFLEAAYSLEKSGRYKKAQAALEACFVINNDCVEAQQLQERMFHCI